MAKLIVALVVLMSILCYTHYTVSHDQYTCDTDMDCELIERAFQECLNKLDATNTEDCVKCAQRYNMNEDICY
jgi:hypothetical protein